MTIAKMEVPLPYKYFKFILTAFKAIKGLKYLEESTFLLSYPKT